MTEPRPSLPPMSRMASWVVSSVLVGWLVAYNVIRVTGGSPRDSAVTALIPGALAGAIILGVTIAVWRRRPEGAAPAVMPPPEELDPAARDAFRLAALAAAVLGVVAIAVGVVVGLDWFDTPSDVRSVAKMLVAAWDVVIGAWLVSEANGLRNGHAEALEPFTVAAVLCAVFAAVGISREWQENAQIALIVASAVAAGVAQIAHWRGLGARGVPAGAVVATGLCVLALVASLL